ncbi:MAG: septal ring lytic transglycosylase RlpA family protein [Deinococcales bacterium]
MLNSLAKVVCATMTFSICPSSHVTANSGIASWYGAEFAGRLTSSGEHFDPSQFTAAHPDLALGTEVLVTNLLNGRSVMVRINDRGPYVKGRIIDLSEAAAVHLDMIYMGTTPVKLEVISQQNIHPFAPRPIFEGNFASPQNIPTFHNVIQLPHDNQPPSFLIPIPLRSTN